MENEQEIWQMAYVNGLVYEVSNMGNINKRKGGNDFTPLRRKETNNSIYKTISGVPIHRLVALLFIANPESHRYINHINGNKHDNRSVNLEWCTQSYNVKHAINTGLKPSKNFPVREDLIETFVHKYARRGDRGYYIANRLGISIEIVNKHLATYKQKSP